MTEMSLSKASLSLSLSLSLFLSLSPTLSPPSLPPSLLLLSLQRPRRGRVNGTRPCRWPWPSQRCSPPQPRSPAWSPSPPPPAAPRPRSSLRSAPSWRRPSSEAAGGAGEARLQRSPWGRSCLEAGGQSAAAGCPLLPERDREKTEHLCLEPIIYQTSLVCLKSPSFPFPWGGLHHAACSTAWEMNGSFITST